MNLSLISFTLLFCTLGTLAEIAGFKKQVDNQNGQKSVQELCTELSQVNDPLAKYILKIIREIQAHMHDGIPSMGIPSLDPLKAGNYDFDMNESQFAVNGKLSNTVVRELSTFNVTDIKTSLLHMNVNISLDIPYFTIRGDYRLKGRFLKIFPVYGNGPFILRPVGVKYKIFAFAGLKNGHLHMNTLDFQVNIRDLETEFGGLYGGGIIGNVLNRLLDALGTKLFYRLEPEFHNQIREILMKQINKMLENIPVDEILLSQGE